MVKRYKNKYTLLLSAVIIAVLAFYSVQSITESNTSHERSISKLERKAKTKKARSDYFFNILRDPATNEIPVNIRARELEFAKELPKRQKSLLKTDEISIDWREAGPNDVGGRTRALAVDRTNSNVIIAGGASGGIWKSTDKGNSWTLKSTNSQQLSVTYVTQDPAPGRENIWYYTSGEFDGTIGTNAEGVRLTGTGLYKSTDNGETWNVIQSAGIEAVVDSPYDLMSKIVISPTTGSIFIASNLFGILRSADGGSSFQLTLGDQPGDHFYSEVDVANDGTLVATISEGQNNNSQNISGIYASYDDGLTWTDITPNDYDSPLRAVVAIAPSNNNVAYVWVDFFGTNGFYKLDLLNSTFENRSANLPDFGGDVGNLDTQGSYNMILAVKPDDENFVVLGGTNLFRSFDGFATPATSEFGNWIGGYDIANDIGQYANHHPDQHAFFFDPADANKAWSGHDGGLSYIEDVNTSNQRMSWIKKNNSYNVTQFYHVSISQQANDLRFLGGTQDNGSPFFQFDGQTTTASEDLSSGDGAFSSIGTSHIFTSSQQAFVSMYTLDAGGNITARNEIHPASLQNKLFIHPFVVDPNNDNNIYIPDGNSLWRNASVTSVQNNDGSGTDEGWTNLGEAFSDGISNYTITALEISKSPADILFLGLSNTNGASKVVKLENASTANGGFQNVSIPNPPSGAYITGISVHPNNADEFIVVFGNYNVSSLFYTNNGGQTYTEVEGNLAGTAANPGPSIRDAEILTLSNETIYVLSTSTGVYSTQSISGSGTSWQQEAVNVIGNTPCVYITSRTSDGLIAVATHGRGIFAGSADVTTAVANNVNTPEKFNLSQNYPNPFNPSTNIRFSIPSSSNVLLKVFNIVGQEVALLKDEMMSAGIHEINFDAGTLASGIYYYKIEAGDFISTKKMMLLK